MIVLKTEELQRACLILIKALCDKPIATINLNRGETHRNTIRIKIYLVDTVLEALSRAIRQDKEIKGLQTGKEVQVSLLVDDMILCIKDPQN